MDDELRSLFQKIAADANRRRLAGVVGVGLEGKTKNRQALPRHGAEQLLHHQPGNSMLLPGVQRHHALPVIRDLRQAEMPTEIHQIEDVLLETAATETGPGVEEFRANATVGADGPSHLAHICPTGFAEGGNGVDRADALGQEGIGRELGELTAPEVGAQDFSWGTQWA